MTSRSHTLASDFVKARRSRACDLELGEDIIKLKARTWKRGRKPRSGTTVLVMLQGFN